MELQLQTSTSIDECGYEWCIEYPEYLRNSDSLPIENWLSELWEMRGRVIYDNVHRPSFRHENGNFSDEDPMDALCFHVTARRNGRLIGCARLCRFVDVNSTWTQDLFGRTQVETTLANLGCALHHAGESGRWIVEPEHRTSGVGRRLMSGVHAIGQVLGLRIILGLSGTRQRQDRALMSMGWSLVPGVEPSPAPKFDDDVKFIYFNVEEMKSAEIESSNMMLNLLRPNVI